MSFPHVLEALDLLDAPVDGDTIAAVVDDRGLDVTTEEVRGDRGTTTFLRVHVAGRSGRLSGGASPTTGIVGRLGGIGARPEAVGMVSDADGAVAAVAVMLKLADMTARGDRLAGDVVVATHICPDAPTEPHDPVPFMGVPVPMETMNEHEVDPVMEAVLSIDATKGNRVLNHRGIAITPTVKQGWVLPVAPGLLDVYEVVCGHAPVVLPLSTFDITPYGNGLYHVNSIVQPAVATAAPVVGVAVTVAVAVPGSATGANQAADLDQAVRFVIEAAKRFGGGTLRFYDPDQFDRAVARYGPMDVLQTMGPDGTE